MAEVYLTAGANSNRPTRRTGFVLTSANTMFLLAKPSPERIRQFLSAQRNAAFSYAEVGASRDGAPSHYTVDHSRSKLGSGGDVFARAVEALRRWEMFRLGWVQLLYPETPIEVGATVGILVHRRALWSLNACRIIYLVGGSQPSDNAGRGEESLAVESCQKPAGRFVGPEDHVERYGFAYGTLEAHAESGEERFSIEWRRDDGSVWYDILAFSRPNHVLARLGYPLVRRLQKRFARDSHRAMLRAVASKE